MSIPRVLEPEVMDSEQDAQDYDSMDHSSVNRLFVSDLLQTDWAGGTVLDLGTGTAQIPVELCRQQPDCRIMAIDFSVSMLDLARYNVEASGYAERIQLAHCDAKDLSRVGALFDCVMSNSIVHHIPDPSVVLEQALAVASPGALLFFRDLVRPTDAASVDHLVDSYAGQENEHQQQLFRDSLHASLTVEEVRGLVVQLGFTPETVQASSDRHWTWCARNPE